MDGDLVVDILWRQSNPADIDNIIKYTLDTLKASAIMMIKALLNSQYPKSTLQMINSQSLKKQIYNI
ncbi:hypothetical protein [Campylobacter lanienae]|uniref:hypothetical protein n=1 Tax=Campylobacter lanienae TaxID=75658 RepID=UPI000BB3FDFD|nr:hypothetical protein [Campylobacter lanienae]